VSRAKRKITRFEKDGQKMLRWDFDGHVRSWDLSTGELRETFQHSPPRNIVAMQLSPDAKAFVTSDEVPGEYAGGPPRAASLWNVTTRQSRPLPDKVSAYGNFSPDSKTFATTVDEDDGFSTAVKLFDTGTAEEKLSIPITEPFTRIGGMQFTPDGRLILGGSQTFPARNNWRSFESSLKLWDVASGREVASFASEKTMVGFMRPAFSPDGRTVAATNWRGEKPKLYLFDVPGRKRLTTIMLGEKAIVREPVFSPDGKWIAVATQVIPEELQSNRELDAEDVPQPRIHLVDVALGAVRETLIAPQGFSASVCFSPDGSTLATGGNGKVLLWDLTKPAVAH
jgi:WD40 repeat protein